MRDFALCKPMIMLDITLGMTYANKPQTFKHFLFQKLTPPL